MSNRNRSRRFQRPASPRTQPVDAEPLLPDGTVVVGRVIRAHGADGTLRVQSLSDNPSRFQVGNNLTVASRSRAITDFRELPGSHGLLRLDGLESADAARSLAGQWLIGPADPLPDLPPGEYYHYQLVGLDVVTDQGERLGTLQEVLITGSNDVYVVNSEGGREILIPAVTQVVKEVDLSAGRMLVHLIDGLR